MVSQKIHGIWKLTKSKWSKILSEARKRFLLAQKFIIKEVLPKIDNKKLAHRGLRILCIVVVISVVERVVTKVISNKKKATRFVLGLKILLTIGNIITISLLVRTYLTEITTLYLIFCGSVNRS